MSSVGLPPPPAPSDSREIVPFSLAAAFANSIMLDDTTSPPLPDESSSNRLLLEAVLEVPVLSTPASSGLGIFPFRDAVPGLENPGKQQSAR